MTHLRAFAAIVAMVSATAMAHGPQERRYRVEEFTIPPGTDSPCVAGFQKAAVAASVNDFGVVVGVLTCVSIFDTSAALYYYNYAPFVASAWFGSHELPVIEPGPAYASRINNFGSVFGMQAGWHGTKWSLAGGIETVFDDPTCSIRISYASDGNGRYTVGWGFRRDPDFFNDPWCVKQRWLIRNAAGVETELPFTGAPLSINARSVVVGISGNSAIQYHIPTAQLRVLHHGDDLHRFEAIDLNDRGHVVGRSVTATTDELRFECDPGLALRWDPNGVEHQLPHLPGKVSSRALGIAENGDIVGDSGPGVYCPVGENALERATLWRKDRPIDLNTLIPRSSGITLTSASAINRRGQIAATGIINAEPTQKCPEYTYDGDVATLGTRPCPAMHVFLLTPVNH
jgi:hypothetical protein